MTGSETWLDNNDAMLGKTTFNTIDGALLIVTAVQPTETWRLHVLLAENGATVLEDVNNKVDESDLAIVENDDTAFHNIAAGQYVMWKGELYQALVDISNGMTLASSGSSANLETITGGLANKLLTTSPMSPGGIQIIQPPLANRSSELRLLRGGDSSRCARLWADGEGGNLRLINDGRFLELDGCTLNSTDTGSARLYIGDATTEVKKMFQFKQDGSFADGNGNSTGDMLSKSPSDAKNPQVIKAASNGASTVITILQGGSDTNGIKLTANGEGGNIRLQRGTKHVELDTAFMSDNSETVRLYVGDTTTELKRSFEFLGDGSFKDGLGNNTKTMADAIAQNIAPVALYTVVGEIAGSKDRTNYNYRGNGYATIMLLPKKIVQIDYMYKIMENALVEDYYSFGLSAALLKSRNSSIPTITPKNGGMWFVISSDKMFANFNDLGYATSHTIEDSGYWHCARMHTEQGSVGRWGEKHFPVGSIVFGRCYGQCN
jgi:hypothetical protein